MPCQRPFVAGSRSPKVARQRQIQPLSSSSLQLDSVDSRVPEEVELSTIVDSQMTWPGRSHGAGTLRESDAGKEVTVCGWVDRNRNMGGLVFLDMRDHTGVLQVRACCRRHDARGMHTSLPCRRACIK